MTRVVVVVNRGSGKGCDDGFVERIRTAFATGGWTADVALVHGGDELDARVRRAVAEQADVVVAGGGDGTVSAVAAQLVGTDIELGVLPLGTLNHFAKDLGLALDLEEAVRRVVAGPTLRVDVGEVNGRCFVNNSSLGLYPDIVVDRERQQKRLGRGKWPALLWAGVSAMRRLAFLAVRVEVDGRSVVRRTPFVFVGNNEYRMDGFAIGEREQLTDGRLSLYMAQRPGRLRLVQLALRALVGRLKQARDFDALLATEFVVESRHRRLRVSADGEVLHLTPPLRYAVRPASLSVRGVPGPLPPR